jgi:hypothetical protein
MSERRALSGLGVQYHRQARVTIWRGAVPWPPSAYRSSEHNYKWGRGRPLAPQILAQIRAADEELAR